MGKLRNIYICGDSSCSKERMVPQGGTIPTRIARASVAVGVAGAVPGGAGRDSGQLLQRQDHQGGSSLSALLRKQVSHV